METERTDLETPEIAPDNTDNETVTVVPDERDDGDQGQKDR